LIYRLDLDSDDNTIELDEALKLIYHLGDCLVVIEEVQIFASSHNLPKWLKNMVLTGRHQKIGVLFTSQRMGEINKTILSQCSHLFIGNMVEQNDQRYISGFIGDDVTELAGLEDRDFIYFGRAGKFKIRNDAKI
jgi:DNA helicase HerA-like ATPase